MASENVEDWDQPLPTEPTEPTEGDDDGLATFEESLRQNQIKKLQRYVEMMYYIPAPPPDTKTYPIPSPKAPRIIERLAVPKKLRLMYTAENFADLMEPKGRGERVQRLAGKYISMTPEQLEEVIKSSKAKARQKEDLLKKKQELYYEMLTKLERQCRTQYLNVLIKKFGNFIAKLATTMRIPPTLVEPYARMQRGIFCNILLAIGVQPASQAAIYYNTEEGSEYEVCHKLSHALLSLIIKALDSASTRNPDDMQPIEADFDMDNYIKERLMCAAEKKVQNLSKSQQKGGAKLDTEKLLDINTILKKCEALHFNNQNK